MTNLAKSMTFPVSPPLDAAGRRSFPPLPEPCFAELEALGSLWPRERVILYLGRPRPAPSLLRDLGRMAFLFLLIQGIDDDPGTILRIVARAETRRLLRRELKSRDVALDPETVGLVLDVLTGWPPPASVGDLARCLRLGRRSLQRFLGQARLPNPSRLVTMARFLEVCTLGKRMGISSRDRIASILGSGQASSLGHLGRRVANRPLGRFIGPDATEDPFAFVAEAVGG